MNRNQELATLFQEMATALELTGANPFRVAAHSRVARALESMSEDAAALALADRTKLTAIEGVGDASARKMEEFARTGRIEEHQELMAQIPRGLLEVLQVPGLGPKSVRHLWKDAGVTDLAGLRAALDAGALSGIPRMGPKTLANLRESLDFMARSQGRTRLGEALPLAEALVERLRDVPGIGRVEYAGSLRRGRETIGDLDVLAVVESQEVNAAAMEAFCRGAEKVLAEGPTKCSIRLPEGVQADLRTVPAASWGAALMYFTGSKEHNVRLRERAQAQGLRLNAYGLYPDDGEPAPQDRGAVAVAGRTEEEVYAALGLPWIPPELREDHGELTTPLPRDLIREEDIRAELHAHTTESDGRLSLDQLIAAAKARGFHTIAVTDHSRSSAQANGLSEERLLRQIDAICEAGARAGGIQVLAGSEVDILADGRLDYPDAILEKLDLVVASPHASLRQDPATATARLLAAVTHPLVHILGHPTGRLINSREGLSPDIAALVAAAAEHGTALEVNAHWMRLDLRDHHVRAAVEAGALVAIDCDVHDLEDFQNLRYGVRTARRGWLTASRCVNTWDAATLRRWLKDKRGARPDRAAGGAG